MSTYIRYPGSVTATYPTLASFPPSAAQGTFALDLSTDKLYVYETSDNSWHMVGSGGGGGSVTSVGLALPSIFNVSGSPVTTSGTLTGTLATEPANTVFAGPASGADAPPTFRALVPADLPAGSTYLVNNFTLTPTDITNQFVTLSATPATVNTTILNVAGGINQTYGVDFSVSGTTLSFSGDLATGGNAALVSGDKLVVQFN